MKSLIDDSEFKFSDGYQILYFYGTGMLFASRLNKILSNLELKYNNVEFLCINIDLIKQFIIRFNINVIPTICIFYNGKELKRINGIVMASAIKSIIYNSIK